MAPSKQRDLSTQVPIVRIQETQEVSPEQIPQLLAEINERQWGSVLSILIEAKLKAESMLRNDQVFDSPGRVAFYQGWVAYCDYIISSLETLRTEVRTPEPGPEPGPVF